MNIKEIAAQYIDWRLCALPAIKAEKRPTCSWKVFQQRFPTEAERKLWKDTDAVCIVCGKVSGNLLMIDFDQQGKAFTDFGNKIPRELFDRLVIEKSQSGGFHVIVRSEQSVGKNTILAKDSDGKVLIETRGESGLFLCAPTSGYELIQGNFENIPVLSSDEIEILLSVARSLDQAEKADCKRQTAADSFTRNETIKNRPGDDFNDKGRSFIKQVLQKHGWKYIKEDVLNECWQRPEKIGRQHSATLHRELPLFHAFSANAQPFEGGKTYNFFQVYAILEGSPPESMGRKGALRRDFG